MKAYITKYALTRGILRMDGFISPHDDEIFIIFIEKNTNIVCAKGEWHMSKFDAINESNKMLSNAIASLEKQIEILKNKTF